MDLLWNTSAFLLVNLACLFLLAAWRKRTKMTNLPPGPTPLPFIGNLLQLRASNIIATLKQHVRNRRGIRKIIRKIKKGIKKGFTTLHPGGGSMIAQVPNGKRTIARIA
uniref:Uncharacterized protein n=1 Tax=Sphaerodactylus townsendi TaxID=933632 RepID=A0ACB8FW57_9SAUR